MGNERTERLSDELFSLLGEAGFIQLCEQFGGTRLYVPAAVEGTQLASALGVTAARTLAGRYGRSYLRVPLARALRARHYRGRKGLSNAAIAVKLGLTETGVDKLFQRLPDKPAKGVDPRQLKLF